MLLLLAALIWDKMAKNVFDGALIVIIFGGNLKKRISKGVPLDNMILELR
jgi:hypothetical protein